MVHGGERKGKKDETWKAREGGGKLGGACKKKKAVAAKAKDSPQRRAKKG